MTQLDESAFLQLFKVKPDRAFQMLMNAFRDRVYLFCLRAAANADDAQDLAQETFIRVWKGLENFRGDSSLTTWIYRIAWNVSASYLERKGNAPDMVGYEEEEDEDETPRIVVSTEDSGFKDFENRQFLETLFQKIPASHRLVLTLYYLQEQTYEEISAVTGWPMGSVKATLHRAKARLREAALTEMKGERVTEGLPI